ncbi:hypothetical protein FS837_002457 [Tulasnella sp. UAMH 9824]|nr:hypothetical protein FS837_002457 [Tulasnella sp. UAMH 9824]
MLRSLALVSVAALAHSANAISYFIDASSYISDWIPVNYTTEGNWPASTLASQQEIVKAADYWNLQGPWSVMNKSIKAPTGDPHDYLSWSPYWWPDCSNVHNTTELTQDQIMTQCNYYQRDGQFNPDRTLVNDTGSFAVLTSAVFYNVLAWRITGDDTYAGKASHFIDTWFINNDTFMNPNLEYSQVIRGANGTGTGAHTGVLDLHCITKISINGWDTKTSAGANVQDAVDFAMTVQPDDEGPTEAYPNIAAIASHYGDPDGKYAAFLSGKEKTYPGQAWFFWNQPLSDSGLQVHIDDTGNILPGPGSSTNSASSSSATGSSGNKSNDASSSVSSSGWMLLGAVAAGIATLF